MHGDKGDDLELMILGGIGIVGGSVLAMLLLRRTRHLKRAIRALSNQNDSLRGALAVRTEQQLLAIGRLLATTARHKEHIDSLADVEFRIFSQYGDDGIIQWLVNRLEIPHRVFVEFGVENYRESNTRFLLMNDNWSGLVMDGSEANVDDIRQSEYFPQHELFAIAAFIDRENVNDLLKAPGFDQEIGLLHIDLDGNDYWIWESIHVVSPVILILEYNAIFGIERAITTPYDPVFDRTKAHHSNLYFGASLPAVHALCMTKGYAFIGCNSAGNNAYFVRRDKLNDTIVEKSLRDGYVSSKFRESRNQSGALDFITGDNRLAAIRGMPVFNVVTAQIEPL